jgi:cytidine deaminase
MISVGASLLFADDVIVTGCNVENASYGKFRVSDILDDDS